MPGDDDTNAPPNNDASFSSEDERTSYIKKGMNEEDVPQTTAQKWIKETRLLDPRKLKFDVKLKHGQLRPIDISHKNRVLQSLYTHPPSETNPVRAVVWESQGMPKLRSCAIIFLRSSATFLSQSGRVIATSSQDSIPHVHWPNFVRSWKKKGGRLQRLTQHLLTILVGYDGAL